MSDLLQPPRVVVVDAVERALAEDLTPLGDLTSSLLPQDLVATARFVARATGVIAGRDCAAETFAQVDPTVSLVWAVEDGNCVGPGTVIATATGRLASILTAERTNKAFNFPTCSAADSNVLNF